MKSYKKSIFALFFMLPFLGFAQEGKQIKLKISGFVSAESMFDTRKTVNSREGEVVLYPARPEYDDNGEDLNDRSEFFMTSIHSRLNVGISGFEAFGAKGSAAIQGDFVGTSTEKTGLFRLRHAFVKLDWGKDELLAGKYWHPMFVTSSFPNVLHWGAGLPFNVLGRAPQFRYTRELSKNSYFMIAALSQLDFNSPGPDGASSKYVQQAGIPELTGQLKVEVAKGLSLGATAGYKYLKPLTENVNGLKTDERLGSYHMNGWMTLKTPKMVWNLQGIYGQNLYNFVMLGGYGVKKVNANGDYEYTNIKTSSLWSDVYTTQGKVRYGFYAGYTRNLGADDDLAMKDGSFVGLWSRGADIDYVYQLAPRVEFHSGKMMIGTQVFYTAAAYGDTKTNGRVENSAEVGSTRFMIHLKYNF
ncbi:MAG: hypothetical protein ACEPOZ_02330 [Marinifilaceae bacterium]